MQMAASTLGSGLTITTETGEMPPASLRSFLEEMVGTAQQGSFGGVVATGFGGTGFANMRYHSHLDNAANIQYTGNGSAAVTYLCKLAAVVAKSAWALAAETTANFTMPDESPDCNLVWQRARERVCV